MDKAPLVAKLVFMAFMAFFFLRSGLRPGKGEPKAWYDRWIRGVGGVLLFLLAVGGILEVLFGVFDKW